MIWKTALKTLRCNLGLNLLHMLQMAAVMLVSAVMVSAICIRYQTFAVSAVFHAHANDDASRSNTKQYSEIKLREEK